MRMVCLHYKLTLTGSFWLCVKGKFDSDFKPSRGSRVFCNQIPCNTVAKGAYLLCADVHLNLAHFSTTAPYLLRLQEDFVVRLNCRDNEMFVWAFQTTRDIFYV